MNNKEILFKAEKRLENLSNSIFETHGIRIQDNYYQLLEVFCAGYRGEIKLHLLRT